MAKDHYVSQTYLRQFHNESSNNKIYMLEKIKTPSFKDVPIKSICFSKNGNRSHFLGNRNAIEDILKVLEPKFPFAVKDFCKKLFSKESFIILSWMIAYFICCNPFVKEFIEQHLKILIKKVYDLCDKNNKFPPLPKGFAKSAVKISIDHEYPTAMAGPLIYDIYKILLQSKWEVYFNHTDCSYITSDNPVTRLYPFKYSCFQIALTPDVLIKIFLLKSFELKIKDICSKNKILTTNIECIKNATRYIFFNKKDKRIIEIMKKYYGYSLATEIKESGPFLISSQKIIKK